MMIVIIYFILCYMSALDVAFSSLYHDEVPLEEVHMCSTLAAASMLQLVSLAGCDGRQFRRGALEM